MRKFGVEREPRRRAYVASMGSQLYRCGNLALNASRGDVPMLPQWGRNFIVAEMANPGMFWGIVLMLQWGRNFIVAEMSWNQPARVGVILASMGPQLYRCGNCTRGCPRGTTCTCFNGAATLSLRKRHTGYLCPLRKPVASMGPQLYRCGNGRCRSPGAGRHGKASMGPQLYRCGNVSFGLLRPIHQ